MILVLQQPLVCLQLCMISDLFTLYSNTVLSFRLMEVNMQEKKYIRNITPEVFSSYGDVIALKPTSVDGWEIVLKVSDKGWRIAVLEFSRKSTSVLEKHPDSRESFEPLKGIALLLVAAEEDPENFEVFLLDKPVCLYSGVWHQVISISEVSEVKITENLEVSCVYHNLLSEYQGFVTTKD